MALALITGFPGFIAGRLVTRLLDEHDDLRIVALAEPRMADTARERAKACGDGRIEVVEGDITEDRLGIDPERYDQLAAEVDHVHHLAAIYNLAVPLDVAKKVNVTGTEHVVAFCEAAEHLVRHHYVSTAYVAGTRHGVVLESELEEGQDFKNHYESTKHEAEVVVRRSMERKVPTTIYRPAIVVGDSRTGETQKFDGPYYVLRSHSLMRKLHLPPLRLGAHDAPFNVVPVDFVVDAMVAGLEDEAMAGRTLHLVDPKPLVAEALVELLSVAYSGRRPKIGIPLPVLERALTHGPLRKLLAGTPPQSLRYLNHSVLFDTTATQELLAPHGLECPHFHEYVGPMVDFFRVHEDDPALAPA